MTDIDESYVQDILAALPNGLTRSQFNEHCQGDINAGYINEVQAAYWRYFKPAKRPGSSQAESRQMRNRWADPDFRQKRIEAIRAGWKRRMEAVPQRSEQHD